MSYSISTLLTRNLQDVFGACSPKCRGDSPDDRPLEAAVGVANAARTVAARCATLPFSRSTWRRSNNCSTRSAPPDATDPITMHSPDQGKGRPPAWCRG
jgi:hypothetical protein